MLQYKRSHRTGLRWASVAWLALLALACSTDSPTAPEQTPAPPPPTGNNIWNISVSAEPGQLTANSTQPATITVRVRRRSDSQAPANGTTIALSASLGEFGSLGSGASAAVLSLVNGAAQELFFPGGVLGDAVITAQLEGSVGQERVGIREAAVLFITSVVPNVGGESGGTRVTINGTAFTEPLQVAFGGFPASVIRVARDGTSITVDTPRILDPDNFFTTEECDSDGDGEEDGERQLDTPTNVTLTLADGGSTALANGFIYRPNDRACREPVDPPDPPFIQSVVPNTGPAGGGTVVTITGRGFAGPNQIRVFFQNKLAAVSSASRRTIVAVTPPGDLIQESCDDDDDGINGIRSFDTPVQLRIELLSGASETLPDAFTYLASMPGVCVGD